MAKNKNRKQAGEQDRGHEQAAGRGAEQMGSAPEPSPSSSSAQFAGGAKRQKKFGHN